MRIESDDGQELVLGVGKPFEKETAGESQVLVQDNQPEREQLDRTAVIADIRGELAAASGSQIAISIQSQMQEPQIDVARYNEDKKDLAAATAGVQMGIGIVAGVAAIPLGLGVPLLVTAAGVSIFAPPVAALVLVGVAGLFIGSAIYNAIKAYRNPSPNTLASRLFLRKKDYIK